MAWVYIISTGAFEAVWALALKQSDGFSRLAPSVVYIVFLIAVGVVSLALYEA